MTLDLSARTYFLITWLEGTDGVVSAKTVVPPEDSGILDVTAGMICRVFFTDGCYYRARIVDKGEIFTCRTVVVTFSFLLWGL